METPLTQTQSLREDLHYLRGALERQQHLHRRLLPFPVAVILGLYILALCLRRDFAPTWQSPFIDFAGYVLLILVVTLPWLETRRRGEIAPCSGADAIRLLLPWAGLGVGTIMLYQIAGRLSLPTGAVPTMLILLIALTAFVAGLGGFPTLLGVGLGLGAGLEARLLWGQGGWSAFGLLFCAGLIGGALVERHRAKGKQ